MKSFGLAFILTIVGSCFCLPAALAGAHFVPVGPQATLVQTVAFGDPPGTGKHHGGGGHKSRVSKSATPGVSTTKGLSQEDADKEYRKKYGF